MNRLITTVFALVVAGTGISASAQEAPAQPDPAANAAQSLEQLLEQVRQGKRREEAAHRQREAEFIAQRNNQQALLRQAQQDKANEERRSERLEAEFERNKIEIARLDQQLIERLGNLNELFGVLQQVAGDARSNFRSSLTNLEYPDRATNLDILIDKASAGSELPSIAEIEGLWFELHREMTENGKISRFQHDVSTPDGQSVSASLTRVGAFNIISNGKYYRHLTESNKVEELPRQPSGRFTGTIDDLESASPGELVEFAVDPTRGTILGLQVRIPSMYERWKQGGPVGLIISILGAFGILLVLERFFTLSTQRNKVRRQIRVDAADSKNPLGRVLQVYQENRNVDVETLELKLDEAILKETPALERFLTLIKIISAVAPLFGLLGTVTGMILTFQSIVLYGTGDPTVMAGGISQALITTVLGLVVAIPMLLLHSVVAGMSKGIIHILEEQSAGIIAVHAEKEGRNA